MTSDDSNLRSRQIDAAIAEYLQAMESGSRLDREAFLARHADIVAELREFLADYSALKQAAPQPASGSGGEQTTDFSASSVQRHSFTDGAALDVLRYFGDYELVEEIARGGMGVVYKARQATLNRTVAVKMILAGQLASQTEVDRFYAEAQAAATLDHPNIVPIYEVGQHQGQHYFSMGYVAGQSLAQRLLAGPLAPKEAATIVREVALAVHYAHGQGVIHRDIKPANILFDSDGHTRITDFGLAKRQTEASGLTATGQVLGTPSYMPPEQITSSSGQIGPTADVYSLGATLYALLTGRPPFQSASAIDTLKQVLEKDPVPLREFDANVPRDLETITLKCLEKSPDRRYQTAQALAEELNRFLTGHPIQARPVGHIEHAWRWCKRNPVVASLTAAVALSLLVGIVASTFFAVQSSHRADDNLALAKKESDARSEAQSQQNRAENAARTARHQVYDLNMNMAQRAWEEKHVAVLLDLLQRTSPKAGEEDLRGFEWRYWNRLCHRELLTFNSRRKDDANAWSTISPNEDILALAFPNNTVELWDIKSGKNVKTLIREGSGVITHIAFSPDGKRLAASGRDQSIAIWDIATGVQATILKEHGRFASQIAFGPGGQILASVDNAEHGQDTYSRNDIEAVTCWNSATGESSADETVKEYRAKGLRIFFNDEGRLVGVSRDGTVIQWDTIRWDTALSQKSSTKILALQDSSSCLTDLQCIAASADGRLLALGCKDEFIRLWDITSGMVTKTLNGHTDWITSVFSRDGKRLASSGNECVRLWDVDTGEEIMSFRGNENRGQYNLFSPVGFNADGTRLVSKHSNGAFTLWDVAKTPEPKLRQIKLASNLDEVRIAEFRKRGIDRPVVVTPSHFIFSPDAKHVAEGFDDYFWWVRGGLAIRQWDVATGKEESIFEDPPNQTDAGNAAVHALAFSDAGNAAVRALAFSADGKQLYSMTPFGSIKVWDLVSRKKESETLVTPPRIAGNLAVSSDGRHLAELFPDEAVELWDLTGDHKSERLPGLVRGGKLELGDGGSRALAFDPAGKLLACALLNGVHIWNVDTRQEVFTLAVHSSNIITLAFSPDKNRLATSSDDKTIRLWDLSTGLETLTLPGNSKEFATCLAFSPDCQRIASANRQTITIWDTFLGRESTVLHGSGAPIGDLVFSSDGHHLLAVSAIYEIWIWDLDSE